MCRGVGTLICISEGANGYIDEASIFYSNMFDMCMFLGPTH